MLSETERRAAIELDELAEKAGGYLKFCRPLTIEFDYREMTEYCRKKGVSKMDLSEDELKLFEINPPLVYG